tara:strand:+ start:109 stop:5058 length:4950 start_codon:yes stop_codon:yes gene_type:complete
MGQNSFENIQGGETTEEASEEASETQRSGGSSTSSRATSNVRQPCKFEKCLPVFPLGGKFSESAWIPFNQSGNRRGIGFTDAWVLNIPFDLMTQCPTGFDHTQAKSKKEKPDVEAFQKLLGLLVEHNDYVTPNGALTDGPNEKGETNTNTGKPTDAPKDPIVYNCTATNSAGKQVQTPMFTYALEYLYDRFEVVCGVRLFCLIYDKSFSTGRGMGRMVISNQTRRIQCRNATATRTRTLAMECNHKALAYKYQAYRLVCTALQLAQCYKNYYREDAGEDMDCGEEMDTDDDTDDVSSGLQTERHTRTNDIFKDFEQANAELENMEKLTDALSPMRLLNPFQSDAREFLTGQNPLTAGLKEKGKIKTEQERWQDYCERSQDNVQDNPVESKDERKWCLFKPTFKTEIFLLRPSLNPRTMAFPPVPATDSSPGKTLQLIFAHPANADLDPNKFPVGSAALLHRMEVALSDGDHMSGLEEASCRVNRMPDPNTPISQLADTCFEDDDVAGATKLLMHTVQDKVLCCSQYCEKMIILWLHAEKKAICELLSHEDEEMQTEGTERNVLMNDHVQSARAELRRMIIRRSVDLIPGGELPAGLLLRLQAAQVLFARQPNKSAVGIGDRMTTVKNMNANDEMNTSLAGWFKQMGVESTDVCPYYTLINKAAEAAYSRHIMTCKLTLITGAFGAGKSFMIDILKELLPRGLVINAASKSLCAGKNGTNAEDGHVVVYDEPPTWAQSSHEGGSLASDAQNEAKQMLSMCMTVHKRSEKCPVREVYQDKTFITSHTEAHVVIGNMSILMGDDSPGGKMSPIQNRSTNCFVRRRHQSKLQKSSAISGSSVQQTPEMCKLTDMWHALDGICAFHALYENCGGEGPDLSFGMRLIEELDASWNWAFGASANTERDTHRTRQALHVSVVRCAAFSTFIKPSTAKLVPELRSSKNSDGVDEYPEWDPAQLIHMAPLLHADARITVWVWAMHKVQTYDMGDKVAMELARFACLDPTAGLQRVLYESNRPKSIARCLGEFEQNNLCDDLRKQREYNRARTRLSDSGISASANTPVPRLEQIGCLYGISQCVSDAKATLENNKYEGGTQHSPSNVQFIPRRFGNGVDYGSVMVDSISSIPALVNRLKDTPKFKDDYRIDANTTSDRTKVLASSYFDVCKFSEEELNCMNKAVEDTQKNELKAAAQVSADEAAAANARAAAEARAAAVARAAAEAQTSSCMKLNQTYFERNMAQAFSNATKEQDRKKLEALAASRAVCISYKQSVLEKLEASQKKVKQCNNGSMFYEQWLSYPVNSAMEIPLDDKKRTNELDGSSAKELIVAAAYMRNQFPPCHIFDADKSVPVQRHPFEIVSTKCGNDDTVKNVLRIDLAWLVSMIDLSHEAALSLRACPGFRLKQESYKNSISVNVVKPVNEQGEETLSGFPEGTWVTLFYMLYVTIRDRVWNDKSETGSNEKTDGFMVPIAQMIDPMSLMRVSFDGLSADAPAYTKRDKLANVRGKVADNAGVMSVNNYTLLFGKMPSGNDLQQYSDAGGASRYYDDLGGTKDPFEKFTQYFLTTRGFVTDTTECAKCLPLARFVENSTTMLTSGGADAVVLGETGSKRPGSPTNGQGKKQCLHTNPACGTCAHTNETITAEETKKKLFERFGNQP